MNVIIYLALLLGCSGYALARGGAPERIGVLILALAIVASHFAPAAGPVRFKTIEWGVMMVDLAMLSAVLVLAVRAQRFWPMWMAAILVNTIVTHLLMLSPNLIPWSYSVAIAGWSYPNPVLLAIGAWRHRSRIRLYGADPAWS
ncbi:hypothetical protein TPR58_18390 [Sphingomonas sp. HF-S3]|uniref:Uncharacterized protein n=1 Tax=Sphingomonas rustica TaxID=3103142 RepID=A0ABV0BC83_9SPHN